MENKIFEIKSFARIKFFQDGNFFSEKINFFDKIFFQEKDNSNGGIEIRRKGQIKFPTNAENSCFLIAKEMQKFFAKKNQGKKPKSIIITIEKNIPLNSGLGGSYLNAFETLKFLNKFWEINFSEEEISKIFEGIFSCHPRARPGDPGFNNSIKKFSLENSILDSRLRGNDKKGVGKKIFILIPKYILIEKEFFLSLCHSREGGNLCCVKNFSEAQKKIKEIFPDLKKFIKIFYENLAEFSEISGKGSAVFGLFDKNISEEKIEKIKEKFSDFGEIIFLD